MPKGRGSGERRGRGGALGHLCQMGLREIWIGEQVEVGWDDGEREPQLDQMLAEAEAEAEWETSAPSGFLGKGRTTIKANLGV